MKARPLVWAAVWAVLAGCAPPQAADRHAGDIAAAAPRAADEGMWTFDNLPVHKASPPEPVYPEREEFQLAASRYAGPCAIDAGTILSTCTGTAGPPERRRPCG